MENGSYPGNDLVIPTRGVMGLRPTQDDERRPLSSDRSPWKLRPPLCHWERSRGICSFTPPHTDVVGTSSQPQTDLSSRPKRSEVEGPAVLSITKPIPDEKPQSPLCHPACPGLPWDRSVPRFLTSQHSRLPRMRLSVEKGAQSLSTPLRFTRNLGERSAGICGSFFQFSRAL
jgi:hypothetical protein